MSRALAVFHGHFGRATVYQLNRPFNVHAHREGHLIFHIGGHAGLRGSARAAQPALRRYRRRESIPWEPHKFPAERFGKRGALPRPLCKRRVVRGRSWPAFRLHQIQTHLDPGPDHPARGGNDLRRSIAQRSRRGTAGSDRRLPRRKLASGGGLAGRSRLRRNNRLSRTQVDQAAAESVGAEIELDAIAREAGLSRPHF